MARGAIGVRLGGRRRALRAQGLELGLEHEAMKHGVPEGLPHEALEDLGLGQFEQSTPVDDA